MRGSDGHKARAGTCGHSGESPEMAATLPDQTGTREFSVKARPLPSPRNPAGITAVTAQIQRGCSRPCASFVGLPSPVCVYIRYIYTYGIHTPYMTKTPFFGRIHTCQLTSYIYAKMAYIYGIFRMYFPSHHKQLENVW
jgi:hypothetical protein